MGGTAGNDKLSTTYARTAVEINPKSVPPSIPANDKTYDGTNTATLASCTVATKVGSDSVACTSAAVTSASSSASPSPQTVTANSITLTGTTAANYVLSTTTATATAKINPKAASVTPAASGKTYGDPDPLLTGTLSGFLVADGVTATYSRTAAAGDPVGTYTISAALSPLGVLGNYSITYNVAPY